MSDQAPLPESYVSEFACRLRGAAVCTRGGRALLVRHQPPGVREPYWVPPGGGVRRGETLQEAAVRELREETGYEGRITGVFGFREVVKPAGLVFEVFFRVSLADEIGEPRCPPEQTLRAARWLTPEELGALTVHPAVVAQWLSDPEGSSTPLARIVMPPVVVTRG